MSKSEKQKFLSPSPSPPGYRTKNILKQQGKHNNIVAYHFLKELNGVMQIPEYWNSLSDPIRGEISQIRSLAFEGLYPNEQSFDRIEQKLKASQESAVTLNIRSTMTSMRELAHQEEAFWDIFAERYQGPGITQIQQDTLVGLHYLPQEDNGKILTFGSARTQTGSAVYDAARWLNKTLVAGSMQEDGSSEGVITGAGPGVMEAANYGGMEGRWDIIQRLRRDLEQARGDTEQEAQIHSMITTARLQLHSIGVRIALPFEASWNDHLQLGLTIEHFAPRKGGLVSATIGRSIADTETQPTKKNPKNPAILVFPGGFGTEDEAWEVACLMQCGKMPEAPIFAVGEKTSDKFASAMETMQEWGTINPDDTDLIIGCNDEVDALKQYHDYYNLEPSDYTKKAITAREPSANNGSAKDVNGYRKK